VEGHQPHAARVPTEQPLHPFAHLLGGLVGEGDRQDLPGLRHVRVDQIGDPVGEHPGLAAAGPSEYQQRSLTVCDGLALGLVETLQQLLKVLGMGVRAHQNPRIDGASAI
jgi:hypothetical protein